MGEEYDECIRDVIDDAFSNYQAPDKEGRSILDLPSWSLWKNTSELLLQQGERSSIEYLIRAFGLNEFEQFCLLLLLEKELDEPMTIRRLNEIGFHDLTPAAMISLFQGERCLIRELYGFFLEGGPLKNWVMQGGKDNGPGPWDAVRLDERLRGLIIGEQWEDSSLKEYGFFIYPGEYDSSEMKGGFGEREYRQWSGLFNSLNVPRVCLIRGVEGVGKKTQIRRYVQEYGIPAFCADAGSLESLNREEQKKVLWRMIRECRLWQAILCLEWKDGIEEETGGNNLVEQAFRLSEDYLFGLVLLQAQEQELKGVPKEAVQVAIPMPTLREAACLWKETGKGFPCAEGLHTEEFAGIMVMTPGQIRRAFIQALGLMKRDGLNRIEEYHIKEACRGLPRGRMVGKAMRVSVKYNFRDLILPPERMRQLEEACSQVKNRYQIYEKWGFSKKNVYGTGISIVFSGPPGTGKTMAAQVLAGELGLELYKIDLAAVVSKYIGETEKNLNQIFEEGRKIQAILFFDEADVLFSKRTEVRDSHDKYSNMEAAFLLQKMEEYTGVAILATNYLQNIDEAFKRRLTYIIDFPFPDQESRRLLWNSMTPEELPLGEDVDFDFLARRFELSGSQIKNSYLNAAFLAARIGDDHVGMEHIMRSIQKELLKSGRQLTQKDLGEYGYLLVERSGVS